VPVDREVVFDLAEMQSFIEYPALARMQNVEGRVIVRVLVTEAGEIGKVIILESTSAIFEFPTISAIFRSKAVEKPAMKDDKPVALWVSIPVVFKLR
jgi:TonB family protein